MTTIKCEIDGKVTEIEVEESFKTAYLEIETESKRNDWKHDWRRRKKECSLERITDEGFQIAGEDDVAGEYEREEERVALRAAIAKLPAEQQDLIQRVYFQEQSHTAIAAELGVDRSAVSHRVQRALAALKKFLEKNS